MAREKSQKIKTKIPDFIIPPNTDLLTQHVQIGEGLLKSQTIEIKPIEIMGTNVAHLIKMPDMHVGNSATDHDLINYFVEYIRSKPNRFVVFPGDEGDGSNSKHSDTTQNQSLLNPEQTIEYLGEKILLPLLGKVAGMSSEYAGHLFAWIFEASGLNIWKFISRLYGNFPILPPGADILIQLPKASRPARTKVFHDPGGSNKDNPLKGVMAISSSYPATHPQKPDEVTAGHFHFNSAAKIVRPGNNIETVSMGGTFKGNEPNQADRFARKKQLGKLYDPPGANTLIWTDRKSHELSTYPFTDLNTGTLLYDALMLRDQVPNKIISDLQGQINSNEPSPKIRIRYQDGVPAVSQYKETPNSQLSNRSQSKQYNSIDVSVTTKRPFLYYPLANLRYGSTGAKEYSPELMEELKFLKDHPHALIGLQRRIIDPQVASNPNRELILNELEELLEPVTEQIIFVMLDGSLRQKPWKKDMGEDSPPLKPGTHLSRNLNAPIVANTASVDIYSGSGQRKSTLHKIRVVDKAVRSSSTHDPIFGLRRMYDWRFKDDPPNIVIGNETPNAGWSRFHDRLNPRGAWVDLIATGWRAPVDTYGQSNILRGAPGGQAIILLPNQEVRIPTSTLSETKDLYEALDLYIGLTNLGLISKFNK